MPLRARLTSLLLLVGPLVLLLVYVVARDAPPGWGCGDAETDPASIERYRAGLAWIVTVAEVATLGVLASALGAADATAWRVRVAITVVAVAAGVAGGIGALLVVPHAAAGIVAGVTLAVVTRAALGGLAGQPLTGAGATAFAVVALLAAVPFAVVLAVTTAATGAVWPVALLVAALLVWPWVDVAQPADVVVIAAVFAALVLPAAAIAIGSQGSGPLMC